VQRAVLLHTREKLDQLQRTVAELEAQLGSRVSGGAASADPSAPPRH
jgi:hypothetical protein